MAKNALKIAMASGMNIQVSRPLLACMSGDFAAVGLFGYLLDQDNFNRNRETVDFYATGESIEQYLGMKRDARIRALNALRDIGLISWEKRGNPGKNYYTIHCEKLEELLEYGRDLISQDRKLVYGIPVNLLAGNPETSLRESRLLVCGNPADYITKPNLTKPNLTQISKDIWQAEERPPIPNPNKEAKITNPLLTHGDIIAEKDLAELLALGQFSRIKYDAKNPSKTLQRVSTLIKEIRSGNFMKAHKWDRTWIGGRGKTLAEIPGVPNTRGMGHIEKDGNIPLTWEQTLEVFRTALAGVQQCRLRGSEYPPGNGNISLQDFIINDRDLENARSPMVAFIFNEYRVPQERDSAKIIDALGPKVVQAGDALLAYHRANCGPEYSGKVLYNFWLTIKKLVDWHERNLPRLQQVNASAHNVLFETECGTASKFLRIVRRAFDEGVMDHHDSTHLGTDGFFIKCPETAEADTQLPANVSWRWNRLISFAAGCTNITLEIPQPRMPGVSKKLEPAKLEVPTRVLTDEERLARRTDSLIGYPFRFDGDELAVIFEKEHIPRYVAQELYKLQNPEQEEDDGDVEVTW